jgi:peptide/nickel transport system ATP-binding protein
MGSPLLQVRELKKYFPLPRRGLGGEVPQLKAVDGVSFDLDRDEVLGLVGESGSGKSTVAYTVVGMYAATAGSILLEGREIAGLTGRRPLAMKRDIQIVFQDPGSSLNPRRSIRAIVERPLKVHAACAREGRGSTAGELLRMVELPCEYLAKYPTGIGGGERQLVSIARAIVARPKLLILDEPTSALDVSVQAKIINTLIRLRREFRLSYLFISHDLSLMRNVADRVAIMYLGRMCEIAATPEFFANPLHPYTRMLISAIPTVSDAEDELKPRRSVPRGEIPSPVNIPSGCSFHTRCPLRVERCRREDPAFREIGAGHWVRCHFAGAGHSGGHVHSAGAADGPGGG